MRILAACTLLALATPVHSQRPARGQELSAPVGNVRYEVTFTKATARERRIDVTTRVAVQGKEPLLLSLPAWTPGAYELSFFARNVLDFRAADADGRALAWDKLDVDTWRIATTGARDVTVSFSYRADSLDNAMAWARPDFAFFNGTNLFLYPEGRDLAFPASVSVKTEPEWRVTTAMPNSGATTSTFGSANYHDLVDMPFFVGDFAVDSAQVIDRWVRVATYPSSQLAGEARAKFWEQLTAMLPPMAGVFGETPFDRYTVFAVFDESSSGGSALEHSSSHLGIYSPYIIGNTALPSITAHEIYHAWNVKRMRPADMVPYRYDRAQPTPWLWVSEGITDYYADLALLRGGVVDSVAFLGLTTGKIEEVQNAPPTALEDASVNTWIHPVDGSGYLYYPKGSLAGFMLDILIRDASDNSAGLDDVMRDVYQKTFKGGRGFTAQDWWGAVARASRGKSFADFNARYVDGREPIAWKEILPLAGIRLKVDSLREPRIGIFTAYDSTVNALRVTELEPEGAAAEAGVKIGDQLVSIGDITVNEGFGPRFRGRYGRAEGQVIPMKVLRDSATVTLNLKVRLSITTQPRLIFETNPGSKAMRVRHGLLTGRIGG